MDFNDLIIKDFDKIFYNRFQEILKLKANYNGPMKLMDFGIGEEKSMPNQLILDALKNAGVGVTEEEKRNEYKLPFLEPVIDDD